MVPLAGCLPRADRLGRLAVQHRAEPSVAVEVRASGCLLASVWWTVVSLGFGTYLGLASRGANAIFGFLGGAESALLAVPDGHGLAARRRVNSIIATRRGVIFEAVPRERLDRWVKQALRR